MTAVRYLFYHLTLESPAILSALSGDPNSVTTLQHIPGNAIRGAVACRLGDPGSDQAKLTTFRELVLGNAVCYLNAYPEQNGRRSLPTPVSLRREKNTKKDKKTFSAHDIASGWPDSQLTRISEQFLTVGETRPTLTQPRINARIHNQRDREKGRAYKDVVNKKEVPHGAVFALESLEAGQTFYGAIQLRAESQAEVEHLESQVKNLVGDRVLVGRSRRAGYGGMARVKWTAARDHEVDGVGTVREDIEPGQEFRILLTSACIARHPETGQIDPAAIVELLEKKFDGAAKYVRKRWEFEIIGGFNNKWRLETPQVQAVAAGSVFVFEAKTPIPVSACREMEHSGVGERKNEGFGRLLFMDPPFSTVELHYPGDKAAETVNNEPPELVEKIEERILIVQARRKIDECAASIADSANWPKNRLPSNSLVGRLRVPLRRGDGEGLSNLDAWLNGDERSRLKNSAMNQLDKCRIKEGGPTLSSWFRDAVKGGEMVSQLLGFNVLKQHYCVVSEASAQQILASHQKRFAEQLVDATLANLAILNKQRQEESAEVRWSEGEGGNE